MKNVIPFPTLEKLQRDMTTSYEELNELYSALQKCYGIIQQLEDRAREVEVQYIDAQDKYQQYTEECDELYR